MVSKHRGSDEALGVTIAVLAVVIYLGALWTGFSRRRLLHPGAAEASQRAGGSAGLLHVRILRLLPADRVSVARDRLADLGTAAGRVPSDERRPARGEFRPRVSAWTPVDGQQRRLRRGAAFRGAPGVARSRLLDGGAVRPAGDVLLADRGPACSGTTAGSFARQAPRRSVWRSCRRNRRCPSCSSRPRTTSWSAAASGARRSAASCRSSASPRGYALLRSQSASLAAAGGAGKLPKLLMLAAGIAALSGWRDGARRQTVQRARRMRSGGAAGHNCAARHVGVARGCRGDAAAGAGVGSNQRLDAADGRLRRLCDVLSAQPVVFPAPPLAVFEPPSLVFALFGVAAVLLILWTLRSGVAWLERVPAGAFLAVFVAAALLPVSSMTGGTRYLYLASAGVSLLIGVAARTWSPRARSRGVAVAGHRAARFRGRRSNRPARTGAGRPR